MGWVTLNWPGSGAVVGSICIPKLDRWKLWRLVGAEERCAGLIEQPLEGRRQVSQNALQVIVGFIQGQPCQGRSIWKKYLKL
jgi:hypothetical protein